MIGQEELDYLYMFARSNHIRVHMVDDLQTTIEKPMFSPLRSGIGNITEVDLSQEQAFTNVDHLISHIEHDILAAVENANPKIVVKDIQKPRGGNTWDEVRADRKTPYRNLYIALYKEDEGSYRYKVGLHNKYLVVI